MGQYLSCFSCFRCCWWTTPEDYYKCEHCKKQLAIECEIVVVPQEPEDKIMCSEDCKTQYTQNNLVKGYQPL